MHASRSMSERALRYGLGLIAVFLIAPAANAFTLNVNCNAKEGLTTINAALQELKRIPLSAPNTINVSGTCREYVLIQNMDRLTLNAINGASIVDASNGTREVIDVANSHGFTLTGFTITATCPASCMSGPGADALSCYFGSDCLLINNTFSGAGNGSGIGVYALSRVVVEGGTVQNNYYGLFTNDSGEMHALGITSQNNVAGVFLNHGGSVVFHAGVDGVTPSIIRNNTGQGIGTDLGATVVVKAPAEITANGAEGISAVLGTKLFVGGGAPGAVSITGNAGSGVSINDVSIAQFAGNASVTGNGSPNVACNAPTVVTAGAIAAAGGVAGLPFTNCSN
ncbi:MAG: hypothetical protein JO173_10265 [Gammaproteobacteria bacterium]|nr:hypothetical protein [Gammaproteobacteria bacterium]